MYSFILLVVTALFLWKVFFPVPSPILGIYSQPGHRGIIKQIFIYILLKLRKRSTENSNDQDAGLGIKKTSDIGELESVKELGPTPLAIDAVLFTGGAKDGTYLVISAARRANKVVQCIVMLHVPGVGLFTHAQHPDTIMIQESDEKGWVVNGIHLEPLEPMRKWKVSFKGDMVKKNDLSLHRVEIDAEYTSDLEYFDFDSDMDIWTISRAMAKEPWSRKYFDTLKAAHQSHYEQFGTVTGIYSIDGEETNFEVSVMRDHTHGSNRDWKLMHRYCLHNFTCEDGTRGFLGVVSQPGIFSFLELGYIYDRNGQKHAVQEVDFKIWNFGENGTDPDDYGFRFKAGDIWYDIQVDVLTRGQAMFGHEWEARVIERFCRYKINGMNGWGVSEWEYRNKTGKQ